MRPIDWIWGLCGAVLIGVATWLAFSLPFVTR